MENLQIMWIILGGTAAIALFWVAIVSLISLIGGWGKLAAAYPPRQPFNETCWVTQYGRFRWGTSYSGVLKVCADAQALHLSVQFFFRPGHSPLSIPWEDITCHQRTFLVELRFHRADAIPMRISRKLSDQLEQVSGGAYTLSSPK